MTHSHALFAALCAAACIALSAAASPSAWANRSIYQVLTDRFAQATDTQQPCGDLHQYCGGVFAGVVRHLDYIQALGFDAVWISPVVENVAGGYHGYWASNLYAINAHFGSAADLRALSDALHARGMYLMVDIVGNHMGEGDTSTYTPFNQAWQYHDCAGCPADCNIHNFFTYPEMEHCRLANLPDLNHQQPSVRETLLQWAVDLVANYSIDGLRIDTVPEVPSDFWSALTTRTGVFTIGEVFNGDVTLVAPYQGALSATLSYPLFFVLRRVFAQRQSMTQLTQALALDAKYFHNTNLLGTFIENHDNTRFLNEQPDRVVYRNALAFVLLSTGIPIIYYGAEQEYAGGNDPACREPLWTSGFVTGGATFALIQRANALRSAFSVSQHALVKSLVGDQVYVFSRGALLVVLANTGSQAPAQQVWTIRKHPFAVGTKVCSFSVAGDCPTVQSNGALIVTMHSGEPNVYVPAASGQCASS